MINDFNELKNRDENQYDICIIGSGAAGISLAKEFTQTSLKVCLLEGGGAHFETTTQSLYDCDIVGLKHSVHDNRARVFGGTTTLWAGQASCFDDFDFQRRDWVSNSGWPITRRDLEPFYVRAAQVMKIDNVTYDTLSWPASETKPPQYDSSKLRFVFSQFTAIPDFRQMYGKELQAAENVHVFLHANVVALETSGNSVEKAEVKTLEGKTGFVKAKYFIICCGTIDTARLLLNSKKHNSKGLGNDHDLVGRYFQDHVHMLSVPIAPQNKSQFQKLFNPRYVTLGKNKVKYHPKIATTFALQQEKKILNIAGDISYEIDDQSPVESAKVIVHSLRRKDLRPQIPKALLNIMKGPHKLIEATLKYFLLDQPLSQTAGTPFLGIQCENEPNSESRVSLSESKDALGMPRVRLKWQMTGLEKKSIETFVETVAQEFQRLGIAHLDPKKLTLPDDPAKFDLKMKDASHHLGTTRMSQDPKTGVVDANCRVHGIENLYVGSCSVFPTGGFSNPTFNMLALCLRMADQLKQRLAGS